MSMLCKIASRPLSICNHNSRLLNKAPRTLMFYPRIALYSKSGPTDGKDDSESCDDPCICIYDTRKFSHNLPGNEANVYFEVLPNIPAGVFRCTQGEVLGLGAGKCWMYKNPEYFSYHHMTYYDMHVSLRSYRKESAKTGRKP